MSIIDPFAQEVSKPRGIVDPFKLQEIVDPFAQAEAQPEAPQEESGFFRQAADLPVGFAKGVAGGVRMMADIFGAGSSVSEGIKGVEDYLGGLLSAQAKNDQKEISRIMKEAEDKGVADQVLAGVKAFTVAPIDTLTQALGTSAPAIVAGLATVLSGGGTLAVAGVTAGVGAGMGAGAVKGTIYEATKEELIKAGVKPEAAEKAATEAQAYDGENLDQILLSAGIGAVAARTGIERAILGKAITKEVTKKGITKATVAEAAPEAVQAGQEQFAENIALQRQGFDVPLERGLVSSATLEAIAGGGLGAGVELATRGVKAEGPRTVEDEQIDALQKLQADDVGEVIQPGAQVEADRTEIRDDAGRSEPSVSVSPGVDEAPTGTSGVDIGRVDSPIADVDDTATRTEEVDTTLAPAKTDFVLSPAYKEVGALQRKLNGLRERTLEPDSQESVIEEYQKAEDDFKKASEAYLADPANAEEISRIRAGEKPTPIAQVTTPAETTTAPIETVSALKPEDADATPAPTSEQKGQASLSITPSGALTLPDLMRQEDPKLQEKFEEIRTGKKKVFKTYAPVVEDMQRTVDELSEFIRQQGADPTDLASLRSATPEVQNAVRLLSAVGQDANNLTLAVKNQEINYARAKTPEAKAEVTDVVSQRKLTEAQNTIRVAREFIADPSKGVQDLVVFSNVREAPPGTQGLEAKLVREAVDKIVADWDNAPKIQVVQSISELPPYMQEQIARDKVNPQGAYDPVSNQVFLISDNLRNKDDIFLTIAHEALGHFGLRSILGNSYTRVMNEIYNGHKEVKKAADVKLKDNPNMSREIAVEEVLAEMAETEAKPTPPLRRLLDAIRRFARRIGVPLRTITDNDLQQLIANASRYVRRNAMKFDPFTRGEVQPGGPAPATKQIQAVFSQFKPGAGPNLQNPGKAPSKLQQLSNNRPIWNNVKGLFNLKSVGSLPPTAKQGMYKIMTLRMLKDLAGNRLPQMARAITVSEQMVAERSRIMRDGADILDKVQDLRKEKNGEKQVKLLGELTVQATMLETDPDPKSKFYKPNKTLTDAWDTLTPKAQEIYREMRTFYENQIDGMVQDMLARVDRNITDPTKRTQMRKDIMDEFGPAKRKGPYFPLKRFGQYWFQVGKGADKEFYMFESAKDRDHWMTERATELVAEGRAPNVEEAIKNVMSSGNSLREGTDSLNSALASEPIMLKVEKMIDDAALDLADPIKQARAVDELKDGIKQLQYLLLPSTNLRKAFIHRKGIAGASPDLVRTFSTSAVNLAYQRARVKYSEQFYNNIENGFAFLEGAPNNQDTRTMRDLLNELDSRASHIVGLEPTGSLEKVSNGVTQFTFLWLLTAPASAMVNVFGAAAVAMPYIGARYGYDKAMGKISSYAAKYVATAPKVKEGNTIFPTLDKSTTLDPIQAAAYQQFLHDNTIDVSLTQDIMGLGQAPFEDYSLSKNKLIRGVSALFHHSERMSREIMNMAAFDLAYADNVKKGMASGINGEAFNAAIETAKDLTMMSIGDFTRASKPPILTGPVTRIVFQFKQYSLLMTYNILRNTMIGFNPRRKNITDEQKAEAREARRRMYGVMGVTALFAGLKGMPIFTATGMIAEVINSIFDDDEEEFVFEYWLQNHLTETVGGDVAASLMTGLIANATNTALSERMSLDLVDLWFRDGTYQKSAEDTMREQFIALLGPSASIGLSFGRALDLHDNYQLDRALETISPTILRNLQIVGRYAREGEAATARGVTIDDDISYSDLFARALGFTPEDIMRKQKAIIDRKGVQNKIEARRERLLAGLYLANYTGDTDLQERVMEKVIEYNESFPEFPITIETIEQSLSRKLDDKAKQEALGGVNEKLYGRIEGAIPTRD